MKKLWLSGFFMGLLLLSSACIAQRKLAAGDNGKIDLTIVQINDVYEIAPLDGGKTGGMARVATIKKQYLLDNPNTFITVCDERKSDLAPLLSSRGFTLERSIDGLYHSHSSEHFYKL